MLKAGKVLNLKSATRTHVRRRGTQWVKQHTSARLKKRQKIARTVRQRMMS